MTVEQIQAVWEMALPSHLLVPDGIPTLQSGIWTVPFRYNDEPHRAVLVDRDLLTREDWLRAVKETLAAVAYTLVYSGNL